MAPSRTTIKVYTTAISIFSQKKHQGIWNYISMQQLILGVIKNERTNVHLWLRKFRLLCNIALPAIHSTRAQVDTQLDKSSTNY